MCSRFRWLALLLFAGLITVSPSWAANDANSVGSQVTLLSSTSPTALSTAIQPATAAVLDPSLTQLRPVQMARVPSYTVTSPTLLATGADQIGFQRTGARSGTSNRHVRWALYGAVIGLAVGLIDGDNEVSNTLIGAGIGFGLSFVMRR